MSRRSPPKYVPTLTEVVKQADAQPVTAPARAPAANSPDVLTEEQLVLRVMERVDTALERRLRETIAEVVIEQTRALAPLLREEIESVVRETVAQAFADELNPGQRPRP
jgi:hypothetical protein